MKKFIFLILSVAVVALFVACDNSEDVAKNDDSPTVNITDNNSTDENTADDNVKDIDDEKSENLVEDNRTDNSEIDYSHYLKLVNAYNSIYGELTTEQIQEDGGANSAGFCYSNLIDLDNNGVLELVLMGVPYDENTLWDTGALDRYYDMQGKLLPLVNVYTISQENELVKLGNFEPASHGNGGVRYGIEYSAKDDLVYLLESFRSDVEHATYYGMNKDMELTEILNYEIVSDFDTSEVDVTLNGDAYDGEELISMLQNDYGDVIFHPVSWLSNEELGELVNRNAQTYSFLSQYDTVSEDINKQEIDYSPYSLLIKAYELDNNIQNTSENTYQVIGMMATKSAYVDSIDMQGFFYANLIDFDNNGVLELVLYSDVEKEYLSEAKVFTIVDNSSVKFLGSIPIVNIQMPVSQNYGIEYTDFDGKTYIINEQQLGVIQSQTTVYGLTDGHFSVEMFFSNNEDVYKINGEVYSSEDYYAILDSYRQGKYAHLFSNLNDIYFQQLADVNIETFMFLEDYEVENFESNNSAYNNGQFYIMEYAPQDMYPPDLVIRDYFKALTMRDYEALVNLNIDTLQIDRLKESHNSDGYRPYIPGYIILGIEQVTPDMLEHSDHSSDLASYLMEIFPEKNGIIMKCTVNEVLDPHTSSLGMQIAGDTYEYYFVMSSDDAEQAEWKIEVISDDKFYW